jgi:hypothetical protein
VPPWVAAGEEQESRLQAAIAVQEAATTQAEAELQAAEAAEEAAEAQAEAKAEALIRRATGRPASLAAGAGAGAGSSGLSADSSEGDGGGPHPAAASESSSSAAAAAAAAARASERRAHEPIRRLAPAAGRRRPAQLPQSKGLGGGRGVVGTTQPLAHAQQRRPGGLSSRHPTGEHRHSVRPTTQGGGGSGGGGGGRPSPPLVTTSSASQADPVAASLRRVS